MTFGEKIKEARKSKKLTQKQLALKIGAAHNSISDWENDKNKPDPDTIELLCGVLEITPNYLLASSSEEFSPAEKLFIKKYRNLGSVGQGHVNSVLDWETDRVSQLQSAAARQSAARIYTYMHKIACAGTGYIFDDIPTDTIEAPYMEGADFIIGVSGDSMEPTYYDGDLVYVRKQETVQLGDIGIFVIHNECYIKELGEYGLLSHNEEYEMIPGDESIQCVGKVLGKVEK